MKSNFLVWTRNIVDGGCSLSPMTGYSDDWKLLDGIRVSNEFPSKASFKMDPENPKGIKLTDSLYNADMLIVASDKLRQLLIDLVVPNIEFLSVTIFNHKKQVIKESYNIIHPIDPVDCLVIDSCQPRWDRIDKTDIAKVKQLVIDESRIDSQRLLFRPKHFKRAILVHRTLAAKIDAAGITGVRWIELTDYPER